MKVFEVAYYDNGVLMVERYEAQVEMQVKSHLNSTYKRQVKLEYIKVIEGEAA